MSEPKPTYEELEREKEYLRRILQGILAADRETRRVEELYKDALREANLYFHREAEKALEARMRIKE